MDLGPSELLIILAVVLVLFGGKKLPELARSLGSAKKAFEDGQNEPKKASAAAPAAIEAAAADGIATGTTVDAEPAAVDAATPPDAT